MGRKTLLGYAGRLLRWSLVAVVLFIALIGYLYIVRGTAVRHVRGVGADATPVAPAEPQFPLSVAMLTGTPLTRGNRVELALNGDGTFPRLWADLRSARRYITIQMYYGKPGQVADTLHEILLARASAGVRVRLLYDAYGAHDIPPDHLATLRRAGVTAVPFRPPRLSTLYVLQSRSHVRGIVIDGRIGWTGAFGIDDKWLGDGQTNAAWRETNVRFEGPAVRQLRSAFVAAWAEATGSRSTRRSSRTARGWPASGSGERASSSACCEASRPFTGAREENAEELLEDRVQAAAEPWQDVFAVELSRFIDDRFGAIMPVHAGLTPFGIDHPHRPGAGIEPVAHLRQGFTGPVVG
jgi:phosphatidylserine/phosphatidylglycerophosphate/cardiolipin synthase-like enzyme